MSMWEDVHDLTITFLLQKKRSYREGKEKKIYNSPAHTRKTHILDNVRHYLQRCPPQKKKSRIAFLAEKILVAFTDISKYWFCLRVIKASMMDVSLPALYSKTPIPQSGRIYAPSGIYSMNW